MSHIPPRPRGSTDHRPVATDPAQERGRVLYHPAFERARMPARPKTRMALIAFDLFLGVTAVFGGIWVVPSIPAAWWQGTPFTGPLIPAVGLTTVGVLALTDAALLLRRKRLGAWASLAAGAGIATFEVVEAATMSLGDWLAPLGIASGHRLIAEGGPLWGPLFLQPFYVVVGAIMMLLAWRLTPPRTLDVVRARLGLGPRIRR